MRANYIFVLLAVAAAPRVAAAEPSSTTTTDATAWHVGIEPQFGVLVPTSKLGTYVTGGLELDYAVTHNITIGADVGFTQPSYASTVMDARAPGGSASYTIRQKELLAGLLATYRFGDSHLVPHVGLGPIMHMLRSTETSNLSPDSSMSQQTKFGVQLAGGVDFQAGPGFLVGDLRIVYSSLDTMLTGSSNAGSLSLLAGYRLVF